MTGTIPLSVLQNAEVDFFDNDMPIPTDKDYTFVTGKGRYLRIRPKAGFLIEMAYYRSTSGEFIYFDIVDNGHLAEDEPSSYVRNFYLNIDTIIDPNTQTPTIKGLNSIYAMKSDDDFRTLASKKYLSYRPDDDTIYNDYFIGAIRLPFTISDDFVIGEDEIMLKSVNTEITAKRLVSDLYAWELGEIVTPKEHNNLLDFVNTECILHLPLIEPLKIDTDYCIGETLKIRYVINLYNGSSSVLVESSKIGGVCLEKNVDLNIKIPYATEHSPQDNSPYNVSFGVMNDVKTPYLEILQNEANLPNGTFTIPVTDEKTLSDERGFIKVSEIELQCLATDSELSKIKTLLNAGVFIHD